MCAFCKNVLGIRGGGIDVNSEKAINFVYFNLLIL